MHKFLSNIFLFGLNVSFTLQNRPEVAKHFCESCINVLFLFCCHCRTSDKLATSPTSEVSKPVNATPSLSPQSSVISPDHHQEDRTPLAPCALQEDSDIDSDIVEGKSLDSVDEIDDSTTPKRTQVVSPVFIPDDVSEPQHEVQVIERPTELPLLTPSPRRPSEPADPDEL